MAQRLTASDRYMADFQDLEMGEAYNGPDWLKDLRQQAISRFSEIGFPTARRGNEPWKYTNVGPIAKASFRQPSADRSVSAAKLRDAVPWQSEWARLVFVDGHYSPTLSAPPAMLDGVSVTSLAEMLRGNGNLVRKHLGQGNSSGDDGFTALNTAFLEDGAMVHIGQGRSLSSPIHLIFVTPEGKDRTVSHPRVLVVAEDNSKATIIESYVGLGSTRYFTNGVSDAFLGEGSQLNHYRLLMESENAFHIGSGRVRLGRNSTFSSVTFETGMEIGRYNLNAILDEPGSSCTLHGLYVTSGTQHIDNNINIDHAKPHTSSRLFYKGILADRSKAVFGGLVLVRPNAQKTDAYQGDKNLILSDEAEVASKPSLEIYADDVKAGHGATAGAIADEALFYMKSRGLDDHTARTLLIKGFTSEVIDKIELVPLRTYLEERVLDSLPDVNGRRL